jgi:WD40 repeat protein
VSKNRSACRVVKVPSLSQLLPIALCVCVAGCGGGEEIDFSKPTSGAGGNTTFTYVSPHAATTPATETKTDTKSSAAKPEAETKSDIAKTPEATEKKKTTPTAGKANIKTVSDKVDPVAADEVDEDNPYANWRKRKFVLSSRLTNVLETRRRVAFSENGRLIVAADQSGEVIVFETRFGTVQSLHELKTGIPACVAVSDAAGLVLIDGGKDGLRVFEMKDLSRLDLFARNEFNTAQRSRSPYQISSGPLTILQFAMKGQKLISANAEGQVQIRSVKNWPKANESDWAAELTIDAHETPISAVAMSLDGQTVATASEAGALNLWSGKTGQLIKELERATVPAMSMCATVNGFAVGRANGVLELWSELDSDEPKVQEVFDRTPSALTSLIVEPKRGLLAKGLESGTADLLEMTNARSLSSKRQHSYPVLAIASTPDQQRILTCAADGYCCAWPSADLAERKRGEDIDAATAVKKPVFRFRLGVLSPNVVSDDATYTKAQKAALASLRAAPGLARNSSAEALKMAARLRRASEADRGSIRTPSEDSNVPASGPKLEPIQSIQTNIRMAHAQNVRVALSDSGETVSLAVSAARGKTDGFVEAWDVPTATKLREWPSDQAFDRIQLLGNGRWLVSLQKPTSKREAPTVGAFDLQAGVVLPGFAEPRVILERDGVVLVGAAGNYGSTAEVVQLLNSETMQQSAGFSTFEAVVPALAMMPDNRPVVSIRDRFTTRLVLLSADSLQEEETLFEGKVKQPWIDQNGRQLDILGVTDIAVSAKGSTLVTHGRFDNRDYRFTIWKKKGAGFNQEDARGVKETTSFLSERGVIGPRMMFVNGQQKSLALITPKGLAVIDTETGKADEQIELPGQMTTFDPKGRWIVTHDGTGSLEVRSLTSPQKAPRKFRAHDAPVRSMAFSGSGEFLVTVGEENQLKVWQLDRWLKTASRDRG